MKQIRKFKEKFTTTNPEEKKILTDTTVQQYVSIILNKTKAQEHEIEKKISFTRNVTVLASFFLPCSGLAHVICRQQFMSYLYFDMYIVPFPSSHKMPKFEAMKTLWVSACMYVDVISVLVLYYDSINNNDDVYDNDV